MRTGRRWLALLFLMLLAACGSPAMADRTPATLAPAATAVPDAPLAPASETAAPAPVTLAPAASAPTPENGARMVDVGGRALWIECQGQGSPTVILEGGLGVYSGTWNQVMPQVAAFTRVCRFDRAGLGQSQPGPLPRTSRVMTADLHALLQNGRIPGPYVLVGQSLAGLNIHLYASAYPQEVAGLVFVDAIHPDLDGRIEQILSPKQTQDRRADLELNQEHIRFTDILSSEAQVKAAGPVPDAPLIAIRHGLPFDAPPDWPSAAVEKLWAELQADLARLTPQGKLIVAEHSHHRIEESEPAVVSAAIHDVVDAARK